MTNVDEQVPEGAQCLICHDALLVQPACALKCGHVYHTACCHQWIEVGKAQCPQCKQPARTDDLRPLDFEMAEVTPQAMQDAQRLHEVSDEDRKRIRDSAAAELEEEERAIAEADEELEELQRVAQEHKRARKELDKQARWDQEECTRLHAEHEDLSKKVAELQTFIDGQLGRNERKLPVPQARQDDPDVREERRKLTKMRPHERLRQLHGALVAARRQDIESSALVREREASCLELEAELAERRQQEAKLTREYRERREFAQRVASTATPAVSSSVAAAGNALPQRSPTRAAGDEAAELKTQQSVGSSIDRNVAVDGGGGGGTAAGGGKFGALLGGGGRPGVGRQPSTAAPTSGRSVAAGVVTASAVRASGTASAASASGAAAVAPAGSAESAFRRSGSAGVGGGIGGGGGGKFSALFGAGSSGTFGARGAGTGASGGATKVQAGLVRQNSLRTRFSDRSD